MVQRAEINTDFGSTSKPGVSQSSTGFKSPDANKFRTSNSVGGDAYQEDSIGRILGQVVAIGGKLASQALDKSLEESYLAGVAKAGIAKSEDELQGNILTRDWQVAGYRDTMGRLADADNSATIAADMARMRSKPPAEFQDYLAEKRTGLLDSFSGMSIEARKKMFANVMLNERAAIAKHGAEHYQYIVETESATVKTAYRTQTQLLTAAKQENATGTANEVYSKATEAAFGNLYTSVVLNPRLPLKNKQSLLFEAAQNALVDDHQMLYKKIMDTPLSDNGGTMGDLMGAKDSYALSGQFLTSMKRTEAFRLAEYQDRSAAMRASWSNPDAPVMSADEVKAFAMDGVRNGAVKDIEPFMKEYYSASAQKLEGAELALQFQAGDVDGIWKAGKSPEQGLTAWVQQIGSKMAPEVAVAKLVGVYTSTGYAGALRAAGELVAPALQALGQGDKMDAGAAKIMQSTFAMLDAADRGGKSGISAQFLSSLSDNQRDKFLMIRENLRNSGDIQAALSTTVATMTQLETMSPEAKSALLGSTSKENKEYLDALKPVGGFRSFLGKYLPQFLGGSSNELVAARDQTSLFENQTRIDVSNSETRLAAYGELVAVTRANPLMPVAARFDKALARLAARTVQTTTGNLTVPSGSTVSSYFGTTFADKVGLALDEMTTANPDERMVFRPNTITGQLGWEALGKDGGVKNSGTIDPSTVGEVVQRLVDAKADKYKAEMGLGKVTVGKDGSTVQYSGLNSADVEPEWMLALRDNLVGSEGVVGKPMKDLSGKLHKDGSPVMVAGVAVSSENKHYPKVEADGTVTQENINKSFMGASNDLAKDAARIARLNGLDNKPAFLLFGEMAYQGGGGFPNTKFRGTDTLQYRPVITALQQGNSEAALAEFKKTVIWSSSGASRQAHYASLIKQAAIKR